MYTIIITTKYASLTFDFTPKSEIKTLNYLGNTISIALKLHKNLYTDGTCRPFYSKTKIEIFESNCLLTSIIIIPSEIHVITFTKIVWELRNTFSKQFATLFKIPFTNQILFTKSSHFTYVEKWLDKKLPKEIETKKGESNVILKRKSPNFWVKIIFTPMQE